MPPGEAAVIAGVFVLSDRVPEPNPPPLSNRGALGLALSVGDGVEQPAKAESRRVARTNGRFVFIVHLVTAGKVSLKAAPDAAPKRIVAKTIRQPPYPTGTQSDETNGIPYAPRMH